MIDWSKVQTEEDRKRATVPTEVSRLQGKEALAQAGLLDDVEVFIAASGDAFLARAWADAQVFRRASTLVQGLGAVLGLTADQLDDLFRFAATIEA